MEPFQLIRFFKTRGKYLSGTLVFIMLSLFAQAEAIGKVDTSVLLTDKEKRWLIDHPEITYSSDPDYPPIEFLNGKGMHNGMSKDILTLLGKKIGLRFNLEPAKSWAEVMEMGQKRSVDMWSSAASTPQRLEYMNFTKPYIKLPAVIIVKTENQNVQTLDTLEGKKIAITSGYAVHEFITKNHSELEIEAVPNVLTGLRMVSLGLVDAMIANIAVAAFYMEQDGIVNLRVGGKSGFTYELAFASRKDSPIINSILEKGLARITHEETQDIYKKWMPQEEETGIIVENLLAWVLAGLLVFAVGSTIVWSLSLNKEVKQRTLELKSAKEEAEKANKAKSNFLSSMSHELRTPMNAILGFAQLLKRNKEQTLSERQKGNVAEIIRAAKHLLELINEILDLETIESGNLSMSIEPVNLSPLVDEIFNVFLPMAEDQGIYFENRIDKQENLNVLADRTRLKQVLLNLISNALKYNNEGGSVILECEGPRNGKLCISIRDTGIGISENQRQAVFEPFNRLGAEGTEIEGTGVGLTITKQLVETMGGSISMESVVGEGSCFTIEFPISDSIVEKVCIKPEVKDSHANLKIEKIPGQMILYVEDNPANLRLVEQIFMEDLSEVRLLSVNNAEMGLDLARVHHPSLILMDINLPGMDGRTAFKRLRSRKETEEIPVIAISANAMEKDIEETLAMGFNAYLVKPIDPEELLKAINAHLV
jgi:signal transduction histidine kinase/ActR/RegA family two-component response regulator